MGKRFFVPNDSEFIQLSGGMEYVRKFEVVGLRWEKYYEPDDLDAECFHPPHNWRLKVFLSECPHMIVWGDDARAVLAAFDLPTEPPEPPPDEV